MHRTSGVATDSSQGWHPEHVPLQQVCAELYGHNSLALTLMRIAAHDVHTRPAAKVDPSRLEQVRSYWQREQS